jgi:hypothetical protein
MVTVVPREGSLDVTILVRASTSLISDPDKIIGIGVEMKDLKAIRVWNRRPIQRKPVSSSVGSIVKLLGAGDEITTIV